jgi:hypothetical protein
MASLSSSDKREIAKGLLLPLLMLGWIVCIWIYAIVQSGHDREQEFPGIAHASLSWYFFNTATMLVAPFIGGSGAIRLLRAAPRTGFPPVIGWLLLLVFALVFFLSCTSCWVEYHRYGKG